MKGPRRLRFGRRHDSDLASPPVALLARRREVSGSGTRRAFVSGSACVLGRAAGGSRFTLVSRMRVLRPAAGCQGLAVPCARRHAGQRNAGAPFGYALVDGAVWGYSGSTPVAEVIATTADYVGGEHPCSSLAGAFSQDLCVSMPPAQRDISGQHVVQRIQQKIDLPGEVERRPRNCARRHTRRSRPVVPRHRIPAAQCLQQSNPRWDGA